MSDGYLKIYRSELLEKIKPRVQTPPVDEDLLGAVDNLAEETQSLVDTLIPALFESIPRTDAAEGETCPKTPISLKNITWRNTPKTPRQPTENSEPNLQLISDFYDLIELVYKLYDISCEEEFTQRCDQLTDVLGLLKDYESYDLVLDNLQSKLQDIRKLKEKLNNVTNKN